jgi:hypothetical protein
MPALAGRGATGRRQLRCGSALRAACGIAVRGVAHSGQNFAVGGASVPQAGQRRAMRLAHSTQNLAPAGFSCWH